jgi:hypothetical protein
MYAAAVIVINSEKVDAWKRHLAHDFKDLAPVGYIESVLAKRLALILWRKARVVRYEATAATAGSDALAAFTHQVGPIVDNAPPALPATTALEQIQKHEAHLSRESGGTIREFEAARARRLEDGVLSETNML